MKLFKTLFLSTIVLFAVVSCDDFLDINTDPNAATSVSPDLLFPPILANTAANRAIEIMPATALFVNSWASNGSAGVFLNPERYTISPFSTGNTWSNWYGSGLRNLTLMINAAETEEPLRPNVAAQAKIFKAYLFFSLSMMWGEIPFTEALNADEFPEPQFDNQETVLRGVIDLLNEAVGQIVLGEPAVGAGDLIYGGNMDQWRKFANSLKLRTYMYLRNQDPSVDTQIADLLTSGDLIRSNADIASIPFFDQDDNANNMWKVNNQFGGFTGMGNGNFFLQVGETLVDMMNDLDDPRRNTYFAFVPDGDGGFNPADFTGQQSGVNGSLGSVNTISQNIIRRDWPNRILTPSEVFFYEAEFLATTGELPGAHNAYIAGVRASLDFLDSYTILDPRAGSLSGISEAEKDDYIAGLPTEFTSQGQAVEAILSQHYIETFDRSPENWSEWKRTKFPTLSLPEQAVLGDIIRRFPYPPSEIASNPNTPQNPPLDTPMWFEN